MRRQRSPTLTPSDRACPTGSRAWCHRPPISSRTARSWRARLRAAIRWSLRIGGDASALRAGVPSALRAGARWSGGADAQHGAANVRQDGAAVRPGPQAVVALAAVDVDATPGNDVAARLEAVAEADPGRHPLTAAVHAVPLGAVSGTLRAPAPRALDVEARGGVGDHVLPHEVPVRGVAAPVAGEDYAPLVRVHDVA